MTGAYKKKSFWVQFVVFFSHCYIGIYAFHLPDII